MKRFEALWAAWEEALAKSDDPAATVAFLSDEDIVELLAGAPPDKRRERNILATEALNRFSRARRAIVLAANDLSEDVQTILQDIEESVQRAADEDERQGATPGFEARNRAREAAVEHLQAKQSLAALERASDRLVVLSKDALARARDPDLYATPAPRKPAH